jgi:hypothetical protein
MSVALSAVGNDRIRPGGNRMPWEIVFGEIDDLYDEAKNYASDGFAIESAEQEAEINRIDKALLAKAQEADAFRVEEKRPLDEQIEAIQERYNPFIQKGKGKVDTARASLKALLTAWRTEQQRKKDADARRIREEAEEAERLAQQAFRQTSVADLEEREEAERLAKRAADLTKQANKASKAATTGTGLRTKRIATMTDQRAAIGAMWKQNPQAFVDLAQQLADTAVRGGARSIDGFNITEEKVAL